MPESKTGGWRLHVLGRAELHHPTGQTTILDRKAAALTALLSLEGPQPRSRLAGLLWPDVRESAARNSLVQLTRKLRRVTDLDVIHGHDQLELHPQVQVDAREASDAFLQGHYRVFTQRSERGVLLAHHDYDDCPDFAEWLLASQERWEEWLSQAYRHEVQQLEDAGQYEQALVWVERLLELDGLSEQTYRSLMRLQYLSGQRHLALEAFERCRAVLRAELGVEPLGETVALAEFVRSSTVVPTRGEVKRSRIPLSVLRPPVLVGREEEWERMELAWQQGQGIILSGPPGVGKSRLLYDFVSSKGRFGRIEARPGDADVPYSTYARSWRNLLRDQPDLELPEWVRQELGRLLPEVWPEPRPPRASAEEKLRFFQAMAELARLVSRGLVAVVSDDVQYYDAPSMELGAYFASCFVPFNRGEGAAHFLSAHRQDELPAAVEKHMREMVEAGLAAWIDVRPLDSRGVQRFLSTLDVPGLGSIAPRLRQYSEGNPLFLLETVKHLFELGGIERGAQDLPLPPKVQKVLEQRFERLPATSQQVARAAAVLRSDFTVEMVAEVLNAPLLDVMTVWENLEAAHILTSSRFSHDLIQESVTRGTPNSLLAALHRSAARVLERHGADPARIARHWLDGKDALRAAPFLERAALAAKNDLLLAESASLYEEVAEIYADAGERDRAFGIYLTLVQEVLKEFDLKERFERALTSLEGLAFTPWQRLKASLCRALYLSRVGHLAEATSTARPALEEAAAVGDTVLEAELANLLGVALVGQQQLEEAASMLDRAVALYERAGRHNERLSVMQNHGAILFRLGRLEQATRVYRDVAQGAARTGDRLLEIGALSSCAASLSARGLKRDAYRVAQRAALRLGNVEGSARHHASVFLTLGALARDLGEYARALEALRSARDAARDYSGLLEAMALKHLASVHLQLGAWDAVNDLVDAVVKHPNATVELRGAALGLLGEARAFQGLDATDVLREAAQSFERNPAQKDACRVALARVLVLTPQEALVVTSEVLGHARTAGTFDVQVTALAREARCLLDLGRAAEALVRADEAADLLERYGSCESSPGEVLLVRALALSACGLGTAGAALEEARKWVVATTGEHVPAQFHTSFTEAHPAHRTILRWVNHGGAMRSISPRST